MSASVSAGGRTAGANPLFAESTDRRQMVSQIKEQWRKGGIPDAQEFLKDNPGIAQRRSLALELAYEEYCLREEAGTKLDAWHFCRRFPSISRSLMRQIEVHQYLLRHPGMLEAAGQFNWPEPGEDHFGFDVIEELGRGALARVYLCRQPAVGGRQVVLKVAQHGAYEADTLGRLKHPNIVPVYSVLEDEASGASCICMPFCGRATLCDVLDLAYARGRPPTRSRVILDAARLQESVGDRYDCFEDRDRRMDVSNYLDGVLLLGQQLADALAHAHSQRVVHGDLKPSNVLVTPSGRPMLLDFNLSQDRNQPAAMTGGTLPYMSPEQIEAAIVNPSSARAGLDERADIFSLGVILYELLAGELPFGPVAEPLVTRSVASRLLESQRRGPGPLSAANLSVDAELARFIERCMAFDVRDRPAAMQEVVSGLAHHLSSTRRTVRWTRVHRRRVMAGALGAFLAGATAAAYLISRPPYDQRLYQQGVACLVDGRWEEAIEMLTRSLAENPRRAEAYMLRGRARLQLDDYRAAREDFRSASQLEMTGVSEVCRAFCDSRLGDHLAAKHRYENALRLGFQSSGLHNNLGYTYWRTTSDLATARRHFERAIALGTTSPTALLNRAQLRLHEARQRMQEPRHTPSLVAPAAIDELEEALDRVPPSGPLFLIAACLYGIAAREDTQYTAPCLQYAQQAIRYGCDKSAFADDPAFDAVRNRLGPLLAAVEARFELEPIQPLVDPLEGWSEAVPRR